MAPDQRIDLAFARLLVKVGTKLVERSLAGLAAFAVFLGVGVAIGGGFVVRNFRNPVLYAIHDIESRDILLVQQVHCLRLTLAEYRDQYVGAGDFLLTRRLHMKDRAL